MTPQLSNPNLLSETNDLNTGLNNSDLLQDTRDANSWRPLRLLNLYRLVLSGLFVVLFFTGPAQNILGKHNPGLFEIASILYLAFSIISSFTIRHRFLPFRLQTNIQIITDIVLLTLLMHASGGLASGIGILIVVAVAGGSILIAGRLAILYAAIAALSVLAEQVYGQLTQAFPDTTYTQAGILGIAFFATAILSNVLAQRLRESEELANKRGVDLANMEQLNEHIIHNLQSGLIVIDQENCTRLVNEAARKLLMSPIIQDRQPLEELSPQLSKQLIDWLGNPQSTPQGFRPTEEASYVLPRFTRLGKGISAGTLIFLQDSSSISQQLQQMKLASLGRLTASIAHEIRNPLGAISHAAQLLEESPKLEKEDIRLTEIIQDHSRRMNTIVENVLQLSRREQSHPKEIVLENWLGNFVTEFCLSENLTPNRLSIDIHPQDTVIYVDSNHLHQILWNLCCNAIKYGAQESSESSIIIRGGISDDTKTPWLDVIDFGSGVQTSSIQKIFEPFHTTSTEGTGLGLYIARELCECNNARLSYVELPTAGGCFRISFSNPDRLNIQT